VTAGSRCQGTAGSRSQGTARSRSQGTAGSRSIPQADLKSRLGRSRDCRIHVTMVLYCSTGDCIPTSASSNFGLIILQNSPPHKIDFSFLNFGIRR